MSSEASNELVSFHQFIGLALARGETTLSPEELLLQWRSERPLEGDTLAVYEALQDVAAGDTGTALEDYEPRLLAQHGFSKLQ